MIAMWALKGAIFWLRAAALAILSSPVLFIAWKVMR
jgi:hypothetical protein